MSAARISRTGLLAAGLALGLALGLGAAAPALSQSADANAAPRLAQLTEAAEAGQVEAQYALALRYHQGAGVAQNYATAAGWLAQAANAGHAPSQNLLGRYLFEGLGTTRDPAAARRLLREAAKAGDGQHLYDYARVIESGDGIEGGARPDAVAAVPVYEAAAAQGHVEAAVSLGVLLQSGENGVAQDLVRARALYQTAAQAGSARALNNLGLMYVRGEGVEQDYERAVVLFTAAAEAGLTTAYTNLAVMYENGFGVPVDEARAAELYRAGGRGAPAGDADIAALSDPAPFWDDRLAAPGEGDDARATILARAQAGDPIDGFRLAYLLMSAEGAGHAEWAVAARAFARLAEIGHGPSMANLGAMYLHGRGVAQDYVLGAMWLTRAQAAGIARAGDVLSVWAPRLTADQINEAQARASARARPTRP